MGCPSGAGGSGDAALPSGAAGAGSGEAAARCAMPGSLRVRTTPSCCMRCCAAPSSCCQAACVALDSEWRRRGSGGDAADGDGCTAAAWAATAGKAGGMARNTAAIRSTSCGEGGCPRRWRVMV